MVSGHLYRAGWAFSKSEFPPRGTIPTERRRFFVFDHERLYLEKVEPDSHQRSNAANLHWWLNLRVLD